MIVQFKDIKDLTSSPAQPEKIHVYKSGLNKGKIRKLKAKPARVGMLPISEKTIWTWVREGKFPSPIRLNGRTVWNLADVEAWIADQKSKVTVLKGGA